jgi:hypothetical protein
MATQAKGPTFQVINEACAKGSETEMCGTCEMCLKVAPLLDDIKEVREILKQISMFKLFQEMIWKVGLCSTGIRGLKEIVENADPEKSNIIYGLFFPFHRIETTIAKLKQVTPGSGTEVVITRKEFADCVRNAYPEVMTMLAQATAIDDVHILLGTLLHGRDPS